MARQRWQTETDGMRDLYFETADRILALLRTPRGEGEAEALAAPVVRIRTRCQIEGPNYRETDEFWADFERAYQLAATARRGEGGGE